MTNDLIVNCSTNKQAIKAAATDKLAGRATVQAALDAWRNARGSLRMSGKAKLTSGQPLTRDEADELFG